MTDYTDAIAQRVQDALTRHGVSIVWLADTTGIALPTLQRHLQSLSPFTITELDAIANALGISITTLLTDTQATHHARPGDVSRALDPGVTEQGRRP
ncbi:MAG: helix-turn-helix domain-containing protein [Nocardioides sp.]